MLLRLRVDLDLTEEEIIRWAKLARGFIRKNPGVQWSLPEYKKAAQLAIQQDFNKSSVEELPNTSNGNLNGNLAMLFREFDCQLEDV